MNQLPGLVLFWLLVLLFAQCFPSAVGEVAAPVDRPNVIYIMADDLGIGDVKSFGGERCRIETPHFDRLALEGMRFNDAHAVASVCIPSRIAIMTGRYPWRFRRPERDGPWGFLNPRLATNQFTLGRLLQGAGYRTGYIGKWHLGTLMGTKDGLNQGESNVDYEQPLRVGPVQYGFDYSFILPGSLDMFPYVFVRDNLWVGKVNRRRGWSAFNRVGPASEDFEDYKVLDAFATEAESFIARSASAGPGRPPFFLYLALTAPHTPLSPSSAFQGRSKLGVYGDFVMEADHCVGRVLGVLKEHGLEENTLLIATSDHGAAPYAGRSRKAIAGQMRELEKDGHYACGIYRGYKFSIYEGGTRVPFVVRWPGVVPAGRTCDRLIGLNDLMATLAEVSGQELSVDQGPDSISYWPLMKDPAGPATRQEMILESTRSFAVRKGDWKLAICPGSGCPGQLGNEPRQAEAWRVALDLFGGKPGREDLKRAPFVQLFDLSTDPGESNNLATQESRRVEEMIRILEEQSGAGRSTPGNPLSNGSEGADLFNGVSGFVGLP